MSDLIDRQAAIDALEREKSLVERPITETRWFDFGLRKAQDVLSELPSAQPEIIRCKDCKFAHMTYDGECKYCDIWFPDEKTYMDGDYFCASAERRTDE